MTLESDFSDNNNLFAYLDECGLRQDAEECFAIEVEQNGLPDTFYVKNAYLYTLQAALQRKSQKSDEPPNMLAVTDLTQDLSLRAAYILTDLNDQTLDTHDPKLCVSDNAVAAAIVETHFMDKDNRTNMMDIIGYEGNLLLEQHKSIVRNPHYYHDTYMAEARTLHLACRLKDLQNTMIGIVAMTEGLTPSQKTLPVHRLANAQLTAIKNLEISGKNHLEKRILETAEFMEEISSSTISQQRKAQLSIVPPTSTLDNE